MTDNATRTSGWPLHRVTGVDVWPHRMVSGAAAFLLLHRSGRSGPPFWQGVSGWIEPDEAPHHAALRELREETGLVATALFTVDAIFDLYNWERGTVDAIVPFAAELAGDANPVLSEEHDEWRWAPLADALELVPYEPQRAALRRISEDLLLRPEQAHRYRVDAMPEGPEKSR